MNMNTFIIRITQYFYNIVSLYTVTSRQDITGLNT